MTSAVLEPYLYFRGDCRAAMEFYREAFGGELETRTYDSAPGESPADHPDWLMHATLKGGLAGLMASDTPNASERAAKIELSLNGTDAEALTAAFNALAIGGEVRKPLERQFWGATFGSLTDRFGIDWMVNIWPPQD